MLGEDHQCQENNPGHNGVTFPQILTAYSKVYRTFLQKWER